MSIVKVLNVSNTYFTSYDEVYNAEQSSKVQTSTGIQLPPTPRKRFATGSINALTSTPGHDLIDIPNTVADFSGIDV